MAGYFSLTFLFNIGNHLKHVICHTFYADVDF